MKTIKVSLDFGKDPPAIVVDLFVEGRETPIERYFTFFRGDGKDRFQITPDLIEELLLMKKSLNGSYDEYKAGTHKETLFIDDLESILNF